MENTTINVNSPEFIAAVAAAVAALKPAAAPRVRGGDVSEARALEVAKEMFGSRGCVWTVTHSQTGQPFKETKYRIGWTVEEPSGRFIEDGRRIWGIGRDWKSAIYSAKTYVSGVPVVRPTPEDDLKLAEEARVKAEAEAKLKAEAEAAAEAEAKAAAKAAKKTAKGVSLPAKGKRVA